MLKFEEELYLGIAKAGEPKGKYKLFERIKDDSDNEIGTVSGFFTDNIGNKKYAVVCLDAQYRVDAKTWSSTAATVTDLPLYSGNGAAVDLIMNLYSDTATFNCDKILDWCTDNNYTSEAVSYCRGKSFIVDGVTYYGQLPNLCELFDIIKNRDAISDLDVTAQSYTSLDISYLKNSWTSSQCRDVTAWLVDTRGAIGNVNKASTSAFVIPILELPMN